jgi:hypothetical protein
VKVLVLAENSARSGRRVTPSAAALELLPGSAYGSAMGIRTALLLLLLVAGCNRTAPSEPGGLSDREFIALYVALADAQKTARSPEQFEQTKQKILKEFGATPESMQEFIRVYSRDISRMATIWDSIRVRMDQSINPER